MIPIDERADTFPVGLQGTPFEEVYKALRVVAASVWAVDPAVYRAGMAWGRYALNAPDKLAGFRAVAVAALISAVAPMIKDSQTDAELVEYLRLWRAYKPTFGALGELFSAFGASVEVRAISDEESQSVVPVSDTRLAFYLRITGIDFSRPLSLSEAVEIARRATPLGSRPFAYYAIPSRISVPCGPAPEPAFVFVENDVVAELPAMGYIVLNSETGAILGAAKGHELETVPIPACVIASPEVECVPIPARVLESPEMVVYVPTVVELPEVTFANDTSAGNWIMPRSGETVSINADSVVEGYYWTGSAYQPTTYNSSKVYAAIEWLTSGNTFAGRVEFQFVNYNGTIGIKNNTSGTLVFAQAHLAACHSTDATVVPVYDSGNNAYNAFKYTKNNTDYYYVLDGTQTDWTDDLSSIGYSLSPEPQPDYLDVFFYYNAGTSDAGTSVTFAANDYWSTRIRNDSDKAALENFGVPIGTSDAGMRYVARTAVDSFTFTPIALYSGDGFGDLQADMSNFYCALRSGNPDPVSLYYGVCIWSINPYGTNTLTWKCRITKINGGN